MSLESCNHQNFIVVFNSVVNPVCPVCDAIPPEPLGQTYVSRGSLDVDDFSVGDFIKDSSWHELDLSNIVPAGVTALHIAIGLVSTTAGAQMVIKNADYDGNLNSLHTNSILSPICSWADGLVTCNANRKVKYYLTTGNYTTIHFTVRGWWIL